MISNKCIYALKAVLELSIREEEGPVSIQEIARAQGIPPRFLEAILRELKQAGFAESQRGKEGGYVLTRPPREISVGDIMRLIEGPMIAMDSRLCPEGAGGQPDVFKEVWERAQKALRSVTDETKFDELARNWKERTETYVQDYSI